MQRRSSTASTGTFELMTEEQAARARKGGGVNPYDASPGVRHDGAASGHKDLRRLSEWIRLKRQVTQLKKSDDQSGE